MSVMQPVPADHPLLLAWTAHKKTDEYANSKRWAANEQHLDGSLWALFSAGWYAASEACKGANCGPKGENAGRQAVGDWLSRLQAERHEVAERLAKLREFMAAPKGNPTPRQLTLLAKQERAMSDYVWAMDDRIADAEASE